MKYIKTIIWETFKFRGVTKRKEYWTYVISFYVLGHIISMVLGIIEARYLRTNNLQPDGLMFQKYKFYFNTIFFIPVISATVRRLRDAGLSPWLVLLPVVNMLLCIKPSSEKLSNSI